MKEMEYKAAHIREVLHTEYKDGYYIGIMSYGTHPCAYIGLPIEHPYSGKPYEDIPINCHGELTFSHFGNDIQAGGPKLEWAEDVPDFRYWIGWDYAHYNDFAGGMAEFLKEECQKTGIDIPFEEGHKWTTQEILNECYNVIEQLKALEKDTEQQ